jgi:chromosome segregation ATPase
MTDAALLVDRFVSSTSATDAHNSLQALLDALKGNTISPETIWDDGSLLQALLDVFSLGKHGNVPLEEGPSLIGRIYQYLSKQEGSSVLLKRPAPGILMQSLLDVVSNNDESNYVRVLGLQILNSVCTKHPSLAQSQLLEIPNGLHRLADIMGEPNDQVRNELLGGVAQIIGKWPSCAKIWVFSEVCDTLIEICRAEGGLSGSILVGDCLDLVESLVDPSLADLIWQSPIFAPKLASLLDLRGGSEFIHPPKLTDDLDDILANKQVLPKLTFKEEDIIARVLRIIGILLEQKSTRAQIWKQHAPLCSLVWELALFAPPSGKPVCALPSPKLQQEALEYTGQFFNSPEILARHNGVDRLLYLVCTGGGAASEKHKMGLSQAALYVLRQTLSPQGRQDILTHSLAPPTDGEPAPTAVMKLLNTVFENLESSSTELNRRRINLVGALGALGVFLDTPTNREVMLAIAPTLVGALLTNAEKQEDTIVTLALLRFACEWVVETPTVVQAFLASSHSTCLSILLKDESVGAMVGFLLGLCMEYMSTDEEKHGGWTRQSIMESLGKKGGMSGYQTSLEELKSADLPSSACLLEKQRFLKWYSALVLVIRRRVVQELTRGGGEDEDDGDESNASTKSLNRMVTQQAKELEELRASLSDAKATIESQEGQLAVWKRRVESTPTQLDDMLTEYSRRNVEMEETVASLKTRMQENQDSLQVQVQERDNEIAKLQEMVREWQERERQAQQERDDLHEELQGVTSAYTNLEQEYNQRTQGAAPAGQVSRGQPEGEVSHQEEPPSDELSSLRAENARLRTDALAADDWMAMAVQRMNDIGGQNLALQQEVATLREQMQQATLTGGILSVSTGITQQQLDEEQQRREDVEVRLVECGAANAKLQEEITVLRKQLEQNVAGAADAAALEGLQRRLQEEASRRQKIETELVNSKTDTTTALDSLGEAKSEKEGLERHVASTQNELERALSEIAALLEERHRMEAELVSLEKASNVSAEATAVAEERDAILASKDSELEDRRSVLASKEEELVALRHELTQSRQGLESKAEEITFLQDDVQQSRQSLESKAEEMACLQDNVQSLMQDLKSVRKELRETTRLEREEIQKRDAKIGELESRLTQNEQQSREAGQSDAAGFFGSADGRDEEIERLRSANDAAQEWMAKAVEHHQMLSEQVAALVDDKAALTKQIEELQLSTSNAALFKPDTAANETIGRLERNLSQRTDEVTKLGARIIKLESKIRVKETEMVDVREKVALCDQLQEQLQLLEDNNVSELEMRKLLEGQISQLLSEKESFNEQLSNLRQELDEKNQLTVENMASSSDEMETLTNLLIERDAELEILRDELETTKDAFADADQLRIALQNARDESSRLKAELVDARSSLTALHDKTASFEKLQAELQTMLDEAPRLEANREAEKASLDSLRDEIDSLERDRVSLTSERDFLKETVAEMQTKLDEFEAWAGASQQKITELQNEKESVEQQLISLEESEKDLREQLDTFHDEVAVKSTELFNAREELDELMVLKAELESGLERTQLQNDNLFGKNNSLEQDLKVLEAQRDELLERSNETDALLKEKEETLRAAQDNVAELQEALDGMQKQSSGVVDEWRGE